MAYRNRKTVIVPAHVMTRLGKGGLAGGHKLLDAFIGGDTTPIDWPEDAYGDYIVRKQDLKQCGKGSHNLGFRLLSRLFRDHS
jgi:hypothetical protein